LLARIEEQLEKVENLEKQELERLRDWQSFLGPSVASRDDVYLSGFLLTA